MRLMWFYVKITFSNLKTLIRKDKGVIIVRAEKNQDDIFEIADRPPSPQRTKQLLEKRLDAEIKIGWLESAKKTAKLLGRDLTPDEVQRIQEAQKDIKKDHLFNKDTAAE